MGHVICARHAEAGHDIVHVGCGCEPAGAGGWRVGIERCLSAGVENLVTGRGVFALHAHGWYASAAAAGGGTFWCAAFRRTISGLRGFGFDSLGNTIVHIGFFDLSRGRLAILLDFLFMGGGGRGISRSAHSGCAVHLFLESRVAHAGCMAVGDLLREDRVMGDFVPVDL